MGKFAIEVHVPTVFVETVCTACMILTGFAVFFAVERLSRDRWTGGFELPAFELPQAMLHDEAEVQEEQEGA